MMAIDPESLVDIDETSNSPDSMRHRMAHGIRGQTPIRNQIVIGTRSFSTIAATGVHGVICYLIFEGSITDTEFKLFLDQLGPRLFHNNWSFIDNASIHHTDDARIHMELRLRGRYTFCAPYSPHLKPIELVFAQIKKYIRENEQRALLNPVLVITEAFELYSVGGERAGCIFHISKSSFQL